MFDVNNIFKISFYYSNARVCRFIEIIQTTDNEKRKVAFKQLVFRMMKDIVNKNISNYLNLITNTNKYAIKLYILLKMQCDIFNNNPMQIKLVINELPP